MDKNIENHYSSDDLELKIRAALELAGKDPDRLELKEISIIDQLHTGGHLATQTLGERCGLASTDKILDAGCGIGGSSRFLSKHFNSSVTGIDLVEAFVRVARMLTRAAGLENRVSFIQGDLEDLDIQESTFDVVWCQHTLMNISDKQKTFNEFYRVLKPGGRLILHEIVQKENQEIHLPVPWANSHLISFLETREHLTSLAAETGFTPDFINDATDQAKKWWQKVLAAAPKKGDPPRPLGPHIIFGNNGKEFGRTMTANLHENRIGLMEALLIKT
ncbi:MAG: methyltransferase domain-containing protein [Desulfobacterium sp.]|nr:methyltransferase domain-containing protein [Desulfobacterium sp.]